jgi:hypothetical protein
MKMANNISPGINQLGSEHLKSLIGNINDKEGELFLQSLTSFLLLLGNASLPKSYINFIAQSQLIPIPKGSKIRPIVMVDLFTKVIGQLFLKIYSNQIKQYFEPLQLGVRTKFGTEIIIHNTRASQIHNPTWDYAFLDFKNAFNNISRNEALLQIKLHFPIIFKYLYSLYHQPTKLWVSHNGQWVYIESREGSRQGCALGPFFFSVPVQPFLVILQAIKPIDSSVKTYLDDLSSGSSDLSNFLQSVVNDGPKIGLFLNIDKTVILMGESNETLVNCLNYSNILGIEYPNSIICLKNNPMSGVKCLGTPIGDSIYVKTFLQNKLNDFNSELELIKSIDNTQCEWLIFYFCMRGKINYLLRTIPSYILYQFVREIDLLIHSFICHLIHLESIQKNQINILQLPISAGGFGFGSYELLAPVAYLSSTMSTSVYMIKHKWINEDNIWHNYHVKGFANSYNTFSNNIIHSSPNTPDPVYRIHFSNNFNFQQWNSPFIGIFGLHLQRLLYGKLQQLLIKCYENKLKSNNNQQPFQRYIASSYQHSGKFLLAIPFVSTCFSNREFTVVLRMRLHLPIIDNKLLSHCYSCKKPDGTFHSINIYGDHLFTCRSGNDWKIRHDLVKLEIKKYCGQALIHCKVEPRGIMHDKEGKNIIPDLVLFNSCIHLFTTVALDITITHSFTGKGIGSFTIGNYGKTAEKGKITKYNEVISATFRGSFIPLAFESYGYWCDLVVIFLKKLARAISERNGIPYSTIFHRITTSISAAIQKGNGSLLVNRITNSMSKKHKISDDHDIFIAYLNKMW